MKIAFCTDIHLNHMPWKKAHTFFKSIADAKPDAVICTGDMSEAPELSLHLQWAHRILDGIPFYFVLGNHDFYRGSIQKVRVSLIGKSARYLTRMEPESLDGSMSLIGDDGWYDGGYRSFLDSRLVMTDFHAIDEFRFKSTIEIKSLIEQLATESARRITEKAEICIESGDKHIVIATHVPPFAVCSRAPDGTQSDRDWMPVMSSKIMGDAILALAEKSPDVKFTVLCGHTHTAYSAHIRSNVECYVGSGSYGDPKFSMMSLS